MPVTPTTRSGPPGREQQIFDLDIGAGSRLAITEPRRSRSTCA
jgi:hypothetical protein